MKRRYVFIGLAAIGAIGIAVPALGVDATSSGSLKKVKKQIKQLQTDVAALQAQAPVPGPQGDPGATGPPGLSDLSGNQARSQEHPRP